MKSILIIFGFCFGLPLGINGAGGESSQQTETPYQRALRIHGHSVKMIMDMAATGEPINGVLRLKPSGFLGCGDVGFVFRGERLKDRKPVAIKFYNGNNLEYARREYKMYFHMKAINNTGVEKYGIAGVYYHGPWNGLMVTAYTLLGETLAHQKEFGRVRTYDILSVIKQFIKQSKYMHSCGVRHDDIRLDNILTRNCESFLIGFDAASRMKKDHGGHSMLMAPLRFHKRIKRGPIDDWESFLYTICQLSGVNLDWFDKRVTDKISDDEKGTAELIGNMKGDRDRIREVIGQSLSNNTPLRTVLMVFANEVFSSKAIPNYDAFYELVTDVLRQSFPDEKCFLWITKYLENNIVEVVQEEKVIKSSDRVHSFKIGNIKVPKKFSEYKKFTYSQVNDKFFVLDQQNCNEV